MLPELYTFKAFSTYVTINSCSLQMNYVGTPSAFIQTLGQNYFAQAKLDNWTANRIDDEVVGIFQHVPAPRQVGQRSIAVYSSADERQILVCAINVPQDQCAVWTFFCTQALQREHDLKLARRGLQQLAGLAVRRSALADVSLAFSEQNEQAFAWRAQSVHPVQASENFYQREVAESEIDDPVHARDLQGTILQKTFALTASKARPFEAQMPVSPGPRPPLASVRMNHLIDSFYLFRLLIAYRVTAVGTVTDATRNALSSELTSVMHDRAGMDWLSRWLAEKVAEIGRRIRQLNALQSQPSVIFFLKGGRALNYWLGTPTEGENDWDTQVVINPFLPQVQWYGLFARVHDLLLATLREFQEEFTLLLADNASAFVEFLEREGADQMDVDDPPVAADPMDVDSEQANCKAELIDIGIPRRDQPAAQEEWHRLSAEHALQEGMDGVIFPARMYYINEYLTMIREAFQPGGSVAKTPKRIKRFVQIFGSAGNLVPDPVVQHRMSCLPQSSQKILRFDETHFAQKELLQIIGAQFVQAYALRLDSEICALFDTEFARLIDSPPPLPAGLGDAGLDANQEAAARTVRIAQVLSDWFAPAVRARSDWLYGNADQLVETVSQLHAHLQPTLDAVGAQMVVSGSFAGVLHSRQLRLGPPGHQPAGLEPLWRVLVKLQYLPTVDAQAVWNVVSPAIQDFAAQVAPWARMDVSEAEPANGGQLKADRGAFNFYHAIHPGNPLGYEPLFLKVRLARQEAHLLPPVSTVLGVPVVDLRYQIADYARRAAKVDELGVRQMLNMARRASLIMATQLEIVSDE